MWLIAVTGMNKSNWFFHPRFKWGWNVTFHSIVLCPASQTKTIDTFSRHGYDSESKHELTQNQIIFRLWHELIWIKKIGKHFESWVDLNQYLGIHLSHELILSQFLESRFSHELNRFKSPRYCLNRELIQISQSGSGFKSNHLSRKPQKRSCEVSIEWKAQKKINQVNNKVECPKKVNEAWNEYH